MRRTQKENTARAPLNPDNESPLMRKLPRDLIFLFTCLRGQRRNSEFMKLHDCSQVPL